MKRETLQHHCMDTQDMGCNSGLEGEVVHNQYKQDDMEEGLAYSREDEVKERGQGGSWVQMDLRFVQVQCGQAPVQSVCQHVHSSFF